MSSLKVKRKHMDSMSKEDLVEALIDAQAETLMLKSDLYDLHDQMGSYDLSVEHSTVEPHGSFKFWLGAHEPSWLRHVDLVGIPLFVSVRTCGDCLHFALDWRAKTIIAANERAA